MPSGHAAFSLLVAGIVVALSRRRLVQAIAVLYPVAVGVEIVGTGNHIWLDAIAGAAAAAVGFAVVSAIEHRWRVQRPARRSELVGDGSAG
jgi:membrane-associated phospholipid phosphatase